MKVTALVLIFALSAFLQCVAGTTGIMHGYVRDIGGQPIADALVIVASPSQTDRTYTDKRGFFVFLTLPPDVYSVSAEKGGTSGAYAMGARIHSDQTTFLNLRVSRWIGCGAFLTPVTVSAYQESADTWSLDVSRMEQYPPNAVPPIRLPPVTAVRTPKCL